MYMDDIFTVSDSPDTNTRCWNVVLAWAKLYNICLPEEKRAIQGLRSIKHLGTLATLNTDQRVTFVPLVGRLINFLTHIFQYNITPHTPATVDQKTKQRTLGLLQATSPHRPKIPGFTAPQKYTNEGVKVSLQNLRSFIQGAILSITPSTVDYMASQPNVVFQQNNQMHPHTYGHTNTYYPNTIKHLTIYIDGVASQNTKAIGIVIPQLNFTMTVTLLSAHTQMHTESYAFEIVKMLLIRWISRGHISTDTYAHIISDSFPAIRQQATFKSNTQPTLTLTLLHNIDISLAWVPGKYNPADEASRPHQYTREQALVAAHQKHTHLINNPHLILYNITSAIPIQKTHYQPINPETIKQIIIYTNTPFVMEYALNEHMATCPMITPNPHYLQQLLTATEQKISLVVPLMYPHSSHILNTIIKLQQIYTHTTNHSTNTLQHT